MADQSITRRDLIRTTATVGAIGLAAGGAAGYAGGSRKSGGAAPGTPATGAAPTAAAGGAPIKAVGIFPLSGFVAADGQEMRNGVQLAIEELNARGGVCG